MPLYTAEALVLRTYKLAEADRIVVFLTRDRGKKRGVAAHARRPRSRFTGALEPLTEVRVAYFEKERRELVNLNYAETVRSPLATADPECLTYSHYFAELIYAWAADADADALHRAFDGVVADANVAHHLSADHDALIGCGRVGLAHGTEPGAHSGRRFGNAFTEEEAVGKAV